MKPTGRKANTRFFEHLDPSVPEAIQPPGLMTTSLKEVQQNSRLASGKQEYNTLH